MHFKNSTRLVFRWLAKSIETNKLSDRSCCRCYFLCFYISMLNLKYFLNINLILFLEKNYKEQAQMFYQNHSLSLHWVEIFCNSVFKNRWMWTWKMPYALLPYWARINFMTYWTWTRKIIELPCWAQIDFMTYWS